MSGDGRSVELALPAPQSDKPNLDPNRTYVFDRQQGLANRLGAIIVVPDQQSLHVVAEGKIATAAQEAGLVGHAETDTEAKPTALFVCLGFETVIVEGD